MLRKLLPKIPNPLVSTVSWYVFKEILKGMLTTSVVFCCGLLFIEHLQFFVDLIVSKGTPLKIVLKLLIYTVSFTIPLIIPVGTLFGVMLVMGELSSNNEITAMRSLGIPLTKIFLPMIMLGVFAVGVSFFHANVILPETNHRYLKIYTHIHLANPTMMMRERIFSILGTNKSKKISFLTTSPDGKTMQSVLICDQSDANETKILLAKEGFWTSNDFSAPLIMELLHGQTLVIPKQEQQRETVNISSFEKMEVYVPDNSKKYTRSGRSLREIGAKEIWRRIQMLKQRGAKVNNLYYIELHRKFSMPATCIFFVFLGIPLGMTYSRSGREENYGIGVIVVVLYYIVMNTTLIFASYEMFFPSGLWVWVPNILTGVVAFFVMIFRLRKV